MLFEEVDVLAGRGDFRIAEDFQSGFIGFLSENWFFLFGNLLVLVGNSS